MGKKLKAWEVLKLVKESTSNEKEIKVTRKGDFSDCNINYVIKNGGLYWCAPDTSELNERPSISLKWEFELVEEPVDFIAAVKAYSENKTVRCEYGYNNECVSIYKGGKTAFFKDVDGKAPLQSEILKGKWYIEE